MRQTDRCRNPQLRATIKLARLHQHGQHDEAYATLAEIYGWLTEGFDTTDLKHAEALLELLKG
jgi:hypothetical protein